MIAAGVAQTWCAPPHTRPSAVSVQLRCLHAVIFRTGPCRRGRRSSGFCGIAELASARISRCTCPHAVPSSAHRTLSNIAPPTCSMMRSRKRRLLGGRTALAEAQSVSALADAVLNAVLIESASEIAHVRAQRRSAMSRRAILQALLIAGRSPGHSSSVSSSVISLCSAYWIERLFPLVVPVQRRLGLEIASLFIRVARGQSREIFELPRYIADRDGAAGCCP